MRDSRARIVAAGDETRRRIERDLHDGAQQLLIATGIKLNLAAARGGAGRRPGGYAESSDEAQTELNRALAELRSLASGIAPTALVHGSLDNAVRELALRSPVPTTVRVTGDGVPDEHAAATVYFVVAECLANVAKHAARIAGDASRSGCESPIEVVVTDDGHGGATPRRGRDRASADSSTASRPVAAASVLESGSDGHDLGHGADRHPDADAVSVERPRVARRGRRGAGA